MADSDEQPHGGSSPQLDAEQRPTNTSEAHSEDVRITLSTINNTMGKMAGVLATLCQRLPDSNDEFSPRRKRDHASVGESSDEKSGDTGLPYKRRRRDDALSIHPSDEDSDIRALTEHDKQPQVTDQVQQDDKFLKELADSLDVENIAGPPVQQQLADIVNKRWGKLLPTDKIKTLID